MNKLGKDEEALLRQLCQQHNVNPDQLRILIHIKEGNSYKSSSKRNELKSEIERNIKLWASKT